jgi:glycosyltransferase involved in cell wall biosynthesis
MKFAIMSRILSRQQSGIYAFMIGLLQGIEQLQSDHEYILLVEPGQSLPPSLQLNPERFRVLPLAPATRTSIGKYWWDHIAVGHACKLLNIDALYAPLHMRPVYAPCPVVVHVPDMMYHRFPEQWPWHEQAYIRLFVGRFTTRAAHIAALSESTRRDLIQLLGVGADRVTVVYPGTPAGFAPCSPQEIDTLRAAYRLTQPFILFVGSLHPRKNLVRLLAAFEQVADQVPHDLVIIVSKLWQGAAIEERIRQSPHKSRIHHFTAVPQPDMPHFYSAADLFVFPSLYEGFGFPVLEALACGCPTITSNGSSLPEAAGNAAILVEPDDVAALQQAMLTVLTDPAVRADLHQRALVQAQSFTWTRTAQSTINLLEQAAHSAD